MGVNRKRSLKGVSTVYKTRPDGRRVAYHYYRPTGARLLGEPGSAEFQASYNQASLPASERHARTVFVYFVQAKALGLIKIGMTEWLDKRIIAMRTASPDQLALLAWVRDTTGSLEAELHDRFSELRSHGEWFHPGDPLLRFIGALPQLPESRDIRSTAAPATASAVT